MCYKLRQATARDFTVVTANFNFLLNKLFKGGNYMGKYDIQFIKEGVSSSSLSKKYFNLEYFILMDTISRIHFHSRNMKMLLILRLVFVWSAIANQNIFFCKADQQFDQQSLNDFMSNCIRQDMGK